MTKPRWDRTDTIIALLTAALVSWCVGWAYVACHFIRKFW